MQSQPTLSSALHCILFDLVKEVGFQLAQRLRGSVAFQLLVMRSFSVPILEKDSWNSVTSRRWDVMIRVDGNS